MLVVSTGGSKVTYQDVLCFATCLEVTPALGYDPQPSVTFKHRRDTAKKNDKLLAVGNTCANQIILPVDDRHRRFIRFKDELELAILGAVEFASDSVVYDT